MAKLHTFLMIGCDDNGIHTEASVCRKNIANACIAFAEQDLGPIKFVEVAEGLRDSGDINNGDLAVLEGAKDTGKIDIGEIDCYRDLVEKVNVQIVDLASSVFNFGQFASGDDYIGQDHNNYVDGDSVSQWKIYAITPPGDDLKTRGCEIHTYPTGVRSHNRPDVSSCCTYEDTQTALETIPDL